MAAVAVSVAAVAFALRQTLDTGGTMEVSQASKNSRDVLAEAMVSLLDNDPRVRRPATQGIVESVAAYSQHPTLASAETFYALGLLKYYGEKDFVGAESAYLRAIEMTPEWGWPRNGLGIVLFATGREKGGLESFREALRLEPGWSRPHSDMAILYRLTGRMDEAVREVEAALAIEPMHPINHYNYGVILDLLERHEEARARYEIALERSPGLPPALYNLACGYAREGDLKTAVPYLIESILLDEAFREEALNDSDFERVRNDPQFISVVKDTNL